MFTDKHKKTRQNILAIGKYRKPWIPFGSKDNYAADFQVFFFSSEVDKTAIGSELAGMHKGDAEIYNDSGVKLRQNPNFSAP